MSDLMKRESSGLFRDWWEEFPTWFDWRPARRRRWVPAIDVKKTDEQYLIEADLPGMNEKDVDVNVENDILTVSSQKEEERKEEEEGYLHRERYTSSFRRSFRLPQDVDRKRIDAFFSNGVLTITLPRAGETAGQGRKIPIKGS
jgi:HSP20 family protein